MTPEQSMPVGAKALKRFSEASRAVALAAHASSGLLAGASKTHPILRSRLLEASRLVRAAEGLARMATAVLETPAETANSRSPSTAEAAAERRPCARAEAQAAAPLPRKKRKRQKKSKKKMNSGHEEVSREKEKVKNAEASGAAMDFTEHQEAFDDAWADGARPAGFHPVHKLAATSSPPSSSVDGAHAMAFSIATPPRPSCPTSPAAVPNAFWHSDTVRSRSPEETHELLARATSFLKSRLVEDENGTMQQLQALSARELIDPSQQESLAIAYYEEYGGVGAGERARGPTAIAKVRKR